MIPLLLFLLAIAAVYVGTIETAFSSLMRLSLRLMAERGGRDDRLGYYLDDPIQLFVPARLLIGLIFSLATMFIAILTGRTGVQSLGMLLVFVAIFILACEHVLPLLIVRRNPERVLEMVLPPFDVVARAMRPLTSGLVRLIADPRRDRPEQTGSVQTSSEERGEAAHAYPEAGKEQELIEHDERKLLQSIVNFGDTLVREVMTPRPDMVAIAADATLAELLALFEEQEYSRIPVYSENLDNILGIVFVKDLIRLKGGSESARLQADLPHLVRPATFVPETKRVADLLKEFQRRQTQIAIVVDEYGGTAGLATIEDLLEEIVGEIRDEYDVETEPIAEQPDGSFVFSGKVNFDEVRERLNVDVEPDGFETVGGYVLTRVGRVPTVGERFELDGMTVEVLEAERRRINRVRFKRVPPPAEREDDEPAR
ncbi:MAG: hemolysin family protein [Vicinamibacterales bacterium]